VELAGRLVDALGEERWRGLAAQDAVAGQLLDRHRAAVGVADVEAVRELAGRGGEHGVHVREAEELGRRLIGVRHPALGVLHGDGLGQRPEDAVEPALRRGQPVDQLGVGEREAGAADQQLGERELRRPVAAARAADSHAERAERPAGGRERDRHRPAQAGLLQVPPVLVVVDHRLAQPRGQLRELGPLAAQRAGRRRQLDARELAARHQPARQLLPVIAVELRRQPPRRAVVVDHVDPRGVRDGGHEEADEPAQRLVDVGRPVGDPRRLGEQEQLAPLRLGRGAGGVAGVALPRGPHRDGGAGDHGDQRKEVAGGLHLVPQRADRREQGADDRDDGDVAGVPAHRHAQHREQEPGAPERVGARSDVDDRQDRFRG
jgi:hypothetical protein